MPITYRDGKEVTLVDSKIKIFVLDADVSCCKFASMLSIVARDDALQSRSPYLSNAPLKYIFRSLHQKL